MSNYVPGITKTYEIVKTVSKKLVLNDKVVDYLFNVLTRNEDRKFVLRKGYNNYSEITKDTLRDLLKGDVEKEVIVELDEYPEYDDMPFTITHASPYDHRWPGDYDKDAYEDWKVDEYSISDLFYSDKLDFGWSGVNDKPYFAEHPEEFDWEEEVIVYSDEKLDNERYYVKEN